MERPLYFDDAYLQEFDSEVASVRDGKFVTLKNTLFYPQGGGQPSDEGTLTTKDGAQYQVVFVGKFEGKLSHEVIPEGLRQGDHVHGLINWQRRYTLMRHHTAAHIISGIIHKKTGAMITGNQLGVDKTRIDFSLENFDKEQLSDFINESNRIVDEAHEVTAYWLTKEEAENSESTSKLAKGLPPDVKDIRIVDITNFDAQPDGGTHVGNTKEVGHLTLLKCENKGSNNRRAYFTLR